jgi:hypothetical protein
LWAVRVASRLARPRNLVKKHPTNKFVSCFCPDFMGAEQLQIPLRIVNALWETPEVTALRAFFSGAQVLD